MWTFWNRQIGNLKQNEVLSVGHLTFESKRWSASKSKGSSQWVILPFQLPTYILGNLTKTFQKSQMSRSLRGGEAGHGQLNIEIEWYMLFYLQWLQKLQVDNNVKYIEVNMWMCRFFKYYIYSRLSMIVRVNVVLNRTVVVDSDWHFNNLCGSHLRSQNEFYPTSWWCKLWLLTWLVN